MQSIKDKDFNTLLTKVGHKEMDELITIYNQMTDQLREERIRQSEKNHILDSRVHRTVSLALLTSLYSMKNKIRYFSFRN